ncbi:MAG TPA: hypothetical protein RMH99_01970 [Sandaracinaceae bacterium LLY-WYZ-13_1]|nr:hypothetical protein [Sandaracinaceae bacterium LLY-WYZ-13_1]
MGHPIFHLELTITNGGVDLRLNDFPAATLASGSTPATFAPPINPYLVGELNVLDVRLSPWFDEAGTVTSFWDVDFHAWVRRYEKGDIVEPGGGDLVTEVTIPDDLIERVRDQELELPQSFTHVFSNDAVDFSAELSDAPTYDDPDALRDYAMHLQSLFATADVPALMQESAPRSRVWSVAYDHPQDEIAASMESELTEVVSAPLETDWGRDEVELTPRCGGRVWELSRTGGRPLIATEPDEDGSRIHFEIFVAPRDGRLRWVR